MEHKELVNQAVEAKNFAHAPYSNFRVGAALLTEDNQIITGCNIENASYGLTICAERTAIFKAYSEGFRKFKALALSADTIDYITPCGACRQIIAELCGNIDILLVDGKKEFTLIKAYDLLPLAFGDKQLKNRK